ncbi:antiviral reverse transcriptase Drt4 [Salinicola halophilus]|uniref:antiviral reverse transcriptase Drt4 n=1 Tax=Salinicola halophilus TaxID=184065 RepID=UPI000DA1F810|nr:antiviral reverse transcriptase Drt4 [Salinicola halophilus]
MILGKKRHLHEALTRWNYFPNQKEGIGEIPPCFSTRTFTPEISQILSGENSRALGYDLIEYRATRYNNVPRVLSIVHPKAHSDIVENLINNWESLESVYENKFSIVKPDQHIDGRAFIMNYEQYEDKVANSLDLTFGKRFRVHTDIANCFGSVYSHSLEWTLRGFEESKLNLAKKRNEKESHWSENLDRAVRKSKRNETQGIPIGPGTSSLAVEIILGAIDKNLSKEGFEFIRYIDDYTCLCTTHEDAQKFIRILGTELSKRKMSLNLSKTSIVEQPDPLQPDWVAELMRTKPSTLLESNKSRQLSFSEVIHFLDYAVRLNNITPDGSVLKFAFGSIMHSLSPSHSAILAAYIVNLSWHYPILLPYLDNLQVDEGMEHPIQNLGEKLNIILMEHAKHGRSDGVAWSLFFLLKHKLKIEPEATRAIIDTEDSISITLLSEHAPSEAYVLDYACQLLEGTDLEKDQQWLLLYQLYRKGLIKNAYSDNVFKIMKENEVNFLPNEDEETLPEKYCKVLNNPFQDMEDEKPPTFENWIQRNRS